MRVLVCYDVANGDRAGQRRLRKIAEACRDHGMRVQLSLFECQLSDTQWLLLRTRLLDLYKADQDSLRFYFLSEDCVRRTEHHGVRTPVEVTDPLVI